jgi:exosortase/archaeosortase family protein
MASLIDKVIKKNPVLEQNRTAILIIINVLTIYLIWKLFILFVGEEKIPIELRMWPWFSFQWEVFNQYLRELYLVSTGWLLGVLGHAGTIYDNYRVHGAGIGGVAVGNYCLGIQLFWFFSAIIVLSKGIWWRKLIYIPIGILLLFFFNVLRMVGLCYAVHYYPERIEFNHDYVFNMIMYAMVFLMLWLWNRYFSGSNSIAPTKKVV